MFPWFYYEKRRRNQFLRQQKRPELFSRFRQQLAVDNNDDWRLSQKYKFSFCKFFDDETNDDIQSDVKPIQPDKSI